MCFQIMGQMTMYNVKEVAQSSESTEKFHPTKQVP